MKVLHLTTHLNTGGISTYIRNLIQPLKERGIESHVLSSGGELESEVIELGGQIHQLDIRTKSELSPKVFFNIAKVKELIQEHEIDLLHAHTRVTQVLSYWAAKKASIPFITTCHGFFDRRLGRRLLPAWGNQVVAISQVVADQLREKFQVPPSKITLVNNGVNLKEIDHQLEHVNRKQSRQKFGFTDADKVIGVVSRVSEDKGHLYLIHAINELKIDFPNLKLLIVGEGKYLEELKQKVQELALQSRVVFAGSCRNVIEPLRAMDVFAFTPYFREGFGLNVAEAMACRVPVIATRLGGIKSLIQDGENGILIPPKEHRALCNALTRILNDEKERESFATRGRSTIEEQFTVERMAEELSKLYLKVNQKQESQEKVV